MDRLLRIADAAQQVAQQATGRTDTCILSTRLVIEACRYFGIPAAALPVRVLYFNSIARQAVADGLHPEEWPQGWWTVGFDERHPDAAARREGRWPGHLVASVSPIGEPRWLVDASAAQFMRPEHNLASPPVVAAPFPAPWNDDTPLALDLPEGGMALYGPTYGPLAAMWRESPDWTRKANRLVGAVVRSVRDGSEEQIGG